MFHDNKQQLLLIPVLFLVFLTTFFFGLNPKGYRLINQVEWLKSKNSLLLKNIGIVYSEKTLGALGIDSSVQIEITLQPFATSRKLSRIITVIDDNGDDIITVDQWINGIEISVWETGSGERAARAGALNIVSAESIRTFSVTADNREMNLFVGDSLRAHRKMTKNSMPLRFGNGRLLIGCTPTGKCCWQGELTYLSVQAWRQPPPENARTERPGQQQYMKTGNTAEAAVASATFNFASIKNGVVRERTDNGWNLTIPRYFRIFRHEILTFSKASGKLLHSASDILVNFFGFIPLGFCLSLFLGGKRKAVQVLFPVLITALTISLTIELLQVFIPTRSSQLADVLLNGAGACAGAALTRIRRIGRL